MHKKVQDFNKTQRTEEKPALRAGDVVKVHRKITEGGKERIQIFEGLVIAIRGGQSSSPMITVRKTSFGTGVEIVFPLYSPTIAKVEVVKSAKVRRAKLYYVRDKSPKALRFQYEDVDMDKRIEQAAVELEDTKAETADESDSQKENNNQEDQNDTPSDKAPEQKEKEETPETEEQADAVEKKAEETNEDSAPKEK